MGKKDEISLSKTILIKHYHQNIDNFQFIELQNMYNLHKSM